MIDPVIAWVARSGLALLFGLAALHKTRDLRAFATVVRGYRLVPERVAPLLAASVTACEAALVVALLLPGAASQAALAAALLLLFYSGAIGWNLARGRRSIDCGCLGPAGRQPLSAWLLWRNAGLMAGALLAAQPIAGRALVWVDGLSAVAGVLSLALLFYAANALAAHAARFAEAERRSS